MDEYTDEIQDRVLKLSPYLQEAFLRAVDTLKYRESQSIIESIKESRCSLNDTKQDILREQEVLRDTSDLLASRRIYGDPNDWDGEDREGCAVDNYLRRRNAENMFGGLLSFEDEKRSKHKHKKHGKDKGKSDEKNKKDPCSAKEKKYKSAKRATKDMLRGQQITDEDYQKEPLDMEEAKNASILIIAQGVQDPHARQPHAGLDEVFGRESRLEAKRDPQWLEAANKVQSAFDMIELDADREDTFMTTDSPAPTEIESDQRESVRKRQKKEKKAKKEKKEKKEKKDVLPSSHSQANVKVPEIHFPRERTLEDLKKASENSAKIEMEKDMLMRDLMVRESSNMEQKDQQEEAMMKKLARKKNKHIAEAVGILQQSIAADKALNEAKAAYEMKMMAKLKAYKERNVKSAGTTSMDNGSSEADNFNTSDCGHKKQKKDKKEKKKTKAKEKDDESTDL